MCTILAYSTALDARGKPAKPRYTVFVPLITRDQLLEIVDAPYVTVNSWWNRGYLPKPDDVGGGTRQGHYTLDEAFEIAVFDAIMRASDARRKLAEAAVAVEYFNKRRGALEVLATRWERPITVRVYPVFGFTGVNVTEGLLQDIEQSIKRQHEDYKKQRGGGQSGTLAAREELLADIQRNRYKLTTQAAHTLLHEYALYDEGVTTMVSKISYDPLVPLPKYLQHDVDLYTRMVLEGWAVGHMSFALKPSPFRKLLLNVEDYYTIDIDHIVTALWAYAEEASASS
jgi:hypothetical protein